MYINTKSLSCNIVSLFGKNIRFPLTPIQKKITFIASLAFSLLMICSVISRYYLKSRIKQKVIVRVEESINREKITSTSEIAQQEVMSLIHWDLEEENIPPIEINSMNHTEETDKISEEDLQRGVVISDEVVSKIQSCMKYIIQRKEEGDYKLYNSQRNHRVFSLNIAPDLIFKVKVNKSCKEDSMRERYQKMIKAQTVIRTYELGLLIIPHAKTFTVQVDNKEYEFIAEQKLSIDPSRRVQEQYLKESGDKLDEAIRQLAIFICKTSYSDVEYRNNPILKDSTDEKGNLKFALVDIEEMEDMEVGLFGGVGGRTGLVGLVNEKQGKMVKSIAEQYGVNTSAFAEAYAKRKKDLGTYCKLKECRHSKEVII